MELKPCPFCGGEAIERRAASYPVFWVKCEACEAEGPTKALEKDAVEAWNRRAVKDLGWFDGNEPRDGTGKEDGGNEE